MSEPNREMTRLQALGKEGEGRAETFLLSPPLSQREIDGITPGLRHEEFSQEERRVLEKLESSSAMSNVSILSGEVEIDGIKGSLLIVDEQNPDANLAEDLALIGSTVCRLRNEPTLDLRLVAN